MIQFNKRVVIGGLPRSGSTLFRYILDASPFIVCAPETAFFLKPFADQKKRLNRVAKRVDRALDIGEDVIAEKIACSVSSIEAYDKLMSLYCERNGLNKEVWAEKTPRNCFSYEWLQEDQSDIYFVSMIRDGRDVITSKLPGRDDYHCSIERYIETLGAVYGFCSKNHLIVKYEDLVKSPHEIMCRVFDFFGLHFPMTVLAEYPIPSATRDPAKVNQPKVTHGISQQWVGRWQAPEHTERVDMFMGNPRAVEWLRRSGYY